MTRFEVVPERALVEIEASSTLHAIRGRAARATGVLELGPSGAIATGRLEVEVRDLSWGNPLLDRETRRRVDERAHPMITGDVVADECVDERRHRTRGTITFLDVTREVDGELLVDETTPGTIVVTGEQRFDVREWGLQPPRLLALKVSPTLIVRIRVEARRADE